MSPRKYILTATTVVLIVVIFGLRLVLLEWHVPQDKQPKPDEWVKIVAIGDVACPPPPKTTATTCRMADVAAAVKKLDPAAVLMLGDLQYDKGALTDFQQSFDQYWGELKPKIYAAPGNHEYGTPQARGYFDYWGGAENTSVQAGERAKGYYAAKIGQWTVLAINSNCEYVGGCGAESAQAKWLTATLATNESACTLAFWHHPVYTSGNYQNDAATKNRGTYFWELLEQARADIVLNGHDHNYERFEPQDAKGQAVTRGIRQFTVGTGGKSLYKFKENLSANHAAGSDDAFGYLELGLGSNNYRWKFVTVDNQVIDQGYGLCRR